MVIFNQSFHGEAGVAKTLRLQNSPQGLVGIQKIGLRFIIVTATD